ncbi:MAG: acetylglutamate kinase [Acidobacteriota bacterium]
MIKLGGELLETPERLAGLARAVARAAREAPVVVVHGGGREIDAALAAAGIPKTQVDGLRVTDAATLQVVVAVLAGSVNTRFVAAITAARARAVGLTGADASVAPVRKAPRHRTAGGARVDLGLVGQPIAGAPPTLVRDLLAAGYTPVIACVAADRRGRLFNVNADTLAASLAARLAAARLVVAGATAGVLDAAGGTIPALDQRGIASLIRGGGASAGMVAKLAACRAARTGGVGDVVIVDGRDPARLLAAARGRAVDAATRITA